MERVRASTSYPIVLPPTVVDGRALYDGGIGRGGGIIGAARDGRWAEQVLRRLHASARLPQTAQAQPLLRRVLLAASAHAGGAGHLEPRYDAELDRLDRLEAEGRAYVFYANDQGVKNTERDAEKLARNYERGRMQAFIRIRQVGAVSLRAGGLSFQTPPRARIR